MLEYVADWEMESLMASVKTIALVGIGGYGAMYCSAFLDPRLKDFQVVAVVDPKPWLSKELDALRTVNTAIFTSLEECLERTHVDLAVIASPIQYHARHTIDLLRAGSHVLCEKPLCTTLNEAAQMLVARDKAGKQVTIGYQWSFSDAIQRLKADISAGVLGVPKRLRTIVLWPRSEAYYKRSDWAGRMFDAHGQTVYDSPVHNACAHFLHNMFYVLGDHPTRSAMPRDVIAETYRAYEIGNYDTAAIRCHTMAGVEIVFITSHASGTGHGPEFSFEFENATVRYNPQANNAIIAQFRDGSTRNYGSPEESHYQKLFAAITAARTNLTPLCGIEASLAQIQVMVATQQSRDHIAPFPKSLLRWHSELRTRRIEVEGLHSILQRCFDTGCLPRELGVDWAIEGHEMIVSALNLPPGSETGKIAEGVEAPKVSYKTYVKRRPVVGSSEEIGSL
jgi:predicted dehydrogenase